MSVKEIFIQIGEEVVKKFWKMTGLNTLNRDGENVMIDDSRVVDGNNIIAREDSSMIIEDDNIDNLFV